MNPDGANHVVDGPLPLNGSVLWPGASVDPAGFPGWVQDADGIWHGPDEGDFAWARGTLTVIFSINPDLAPEAAYPAASADCPDPVNPDPEDDPEVLPTVVTSPPDVEAEELPFTGGSTAVLALLAAALMALGVTLVASRRDVDNT